MGCSLENDRYMAFKAWDKICKSKRLGGLGFRRFEDINMSLLAKMAERIASESDAF